MSSLHRSRLNLLRPLAGLSLLAAATLLAGCVSTYGYRGGEGDYYYADPQVDYYGYGPYGSVGYGGDWYGSVTFRYGHPYYDGHPYYRYGRPGYGYPYGGYGGYYHGYRPGYPHPPRHPPYQRPPQQRPPGHEPPPGNENRAPVALRGSQPRLPPREFRNQQPQARPSPPPRPVAPVAPVAPARQAPPPPPPRPVRAERPVRDMGHEP